MNVYRHCGDCSLEQDWQAGPVAATMEKVKEATAGRSPEDVAKLFAEAHRAAAEDVLDVHREKYATVPLMNDLVRKQLCCMVNKGHRHHTMKVPNEFGVDYDPVVQKTEQQQNEAPIETADVPGRVPLFMVTTDGRRIRA